MKAEKDKLVSFHYQIKDDKGCVIDTSYGDKPLTFIMGQDQILEGLEDAMHDKAVGDNFSVTIPPEKAYGVRNEDKVKVLSRAVFGDEPLFVGMECNMFAENQSGKYATMIVVGVDKDKVTVDANHVMAGARLNFEISVLVIRDATSEELLTGQIHHDGASNKHRTLIDLISC